MMIDWFLILKATINKILNINHDQNEIPTTTDSKTVIFSDSLSLHVSASTKTTTANKNGGGRGLTWITNDLCVVAHEALKLLQRTFVMTMCV